MYLLYHYGGWFMTVFTCSHRHSSGLVLDDWEKACGLKSESNTDTGPDAGNYVNLIHS